MLYDGWLMQPRHSRGSVECIIPKNTPDDFVLTTDHDSPAQSRIRRYLSDYKAMVDRSSGNGLKIPKFHQNLHYVRQILKDGCLLNIDGGRPESHNKSSIKKPAKTTQKNKKNISSQIASNYHESLVVQASNDMMNFIVFPDREDNLSGEQSEDEFKGSQFELRFDCEEYSNSKSYSIEITWKGKKIKQTLSTHLCRCIARRLFLHTGEGGCLSKESVVKGYTEVIHDGVTYRAHPSFRGEKA